MIHYFVFDHFHFGPITIYTWGFFVGLGFLTGYLWTLWQARKKGIELEKIAFLTLAIFLGAALGGRILFLLQTPARFFNDISSLWQIQNGGMMIWGGIFGAMVFGWLFLKWQKMGFWRLADIFAAPAALGIAIGRVGCFLLNDHQGAATDLPWGILWPDGIARHPAALYEILMTLGLFGLLWYLEKKEIKICHSERSSALAEQSEESDRSFVVSLLRMTKEKRIKKDGFLFLIFLIGYAIFRFFLDFFRASSGPLADPQFFGLFTSQWVSILVVFGISAVFYGKNHK